MSMQMEGSNMSTKFGLQTQKYFTFDPTHQNTELNN